MTTYLFAMALPFTIGFAIEGVLATIFIVGIIITSLQIKKNHTITEQKKSALVVDINDFDKEKGCEIETCDKNNTETEQCLKESSSSKKNELAEKQNDSDVGEILDKQNVNSEALVTILDDEEDDKLSNEHEAVFDEEETEEISFQNDDSLLKFNTLGIQYRYNFSFMAKLIQSSQEQQTRYGEVLNEVESYKKLKTSVSWKQNRIYFGRTNIAILFFKGRKLCMAFALDPKEWIDTKYHGIDASEVKRFAKTPMILKIISDRKVKYAKYLLSVIAKNNGLDYNQVEDIKEFSLPYQSTAELIDAGLVKVVENKISVKQSNDDNKAIIDKIESITVEEAKELMSDQVANKVLEEATENNASNIHKGHIRNSLRATINTDTLAKNYITGQVVNLANLIEKGLVPKKTQYVKILARGRLDKSLIVEADDFSLDAVRMIRLLGGTVKKIK